MRVTCNNIEIDNKKAIEFRLGEYSCRGLNSITVGAEYVVFGIAYSRENILFGNTPVIQICDDSNRLVFAPLVLFNITEPTPSIYWKIRWREGNLLTLWPSSFYQEYYHDDLSEGINEVKQDFEAVKKKLVDEAYANRNESKTSVP